MPYLEVVEAQANAELTRLDCDNDVRMSPLGEYLIVTEYGRCRRATVIESDKFLTELMQSLPDGAGSEILWDAINAFNTSNLTPTESLIKNLTRLRRGLWETC